MVSRKGHPRSEVVRRLDYADRLPKDPPSPAPKSLDDAKLIPMAYASFISILTYSWINPLMVSPASGHVHLHPPAHWWHINLSKTLRAMPCCIQTFPRRGSLHCDVT